jgi:hypothetical protein
MTRFGFIAAAALFGTAVSASAMPVPPVTTDAGGIVQVAGGCGPGGHRNPWGACVPNYRPVYRACPPGMHLGPYGGRCFRNF